MNKIQETVLTLVPADWEFVPTNTKTITPSLLARMRASKNVEFRFMPDPNDRDRRHMQWRRKANS